jgi:regulator of replication initiation timing
LQGKGNLESELEEQKQLNQQLQEDVKQVGELKAQLEDAKQSALNLAEENEALTERVKGLKKEREKGTVMHSLVVKKTRPTSESQVLPDPLQPNDMSWID